jgi:hypothetical protein
MKELGSPIYTDARLTRSGERNLQGHLLHSKQDLACIFLDRATNLCTTHEIPSLDDRGFDCDSEGCENLIELRIIERDS